MDSLDETFEKSTRNIPTLKANEMFLSFFEIVSKKRLPTKQWEELFNALFDSDLIEFNNVCYFLSLLQKNTIFLNNQSSTQDENFEFLYFFLSIFEICLKCSPNSFIIMKKYNLFKYFWEIVSCFLPTPLINENNGNENSENYYNENDGNENNENYYIENNNNDNHNQNTINLSKIQIKDIIKVSQIISYICNDFLKLTNPLLIGDDIQYISNISQSLLFLISIPQFQNIDQFFTITLFTACSSLFSAISYPLEQVKHFYVICIHLLKSIHYQCDHLFFTNGIQAIYNLLTFYPELYFSFTQFQPDSPFFNLILTLYDKTHISTYPYQLRIITNIFLPLFSGPFSPQIQNQNKRNTLESTNNINNEENQRNYIDILPFIISSELPKHLLKRLDRKEPETITGYIFECIEALSLYPATEGGIPLFIYFVKEGIFTRDYSIFSSTKGIQLMIKLLSILCSQNLLFPNMEFISLNNIVFYTKSGIQIENSDVIFNDLSIIHHLLSTNILTPESYIDIKDELEILIDNLDDNTNVAEISNLLGIILNYFDE